MNPAQTFKSIVSNVQYAAIATVSKDGTPWNSPVYIAFDDHYNFYWASWRNNQHSKNIVENPRVFLVVYDSSSPEGEGKGAYILAEARELTDAAEIEEAMKHHYGRKNKTPRKVEEFMGDYPRRMYKAEPTQLWVNSDGTIDGNFIDVRTEIPLP